MTSLRSSRPLYTAVRAAWYLHLFWLAFVLIMAAYFFAKLVTPAL